MGTKLLTTAEMAEADRLTIASGTSGFELMQAAGEAVAHLAIAMLEGSHGVVVLCGPGNNGGDGFIAAESLRRAGHRVTVYGLGDNGALKGDAAEAAKHWSGAIQPAARAEFQGASLIIDALYGAGLSRDLSGEGAALVDRVNASAVPVLAVDVPSGIDGNTGLVRGTGIRALATVTFFRAKPGHYLMPGADRCGRLHIVDIGIGEAVLEQIRPKAILNDPALWGPAFPWPKAAGHKYSRGHAVVLSGPATQTGAARMAARAALRMGAGLVTLASPPDALPINAAHLTAVMVREAKGADGLAEILDDGRKNAVILGPGIGSGDATRKLIETAFATVPSRAAGTLRAWVLDADALTSYEGQAQALSGEIGKLSGPVVITPHDGEFARLFSAQDAIANEPSKLERTRRAAAFLGAVVVLKGPDTVVASPDGRAAIASGDAPWLATAGSGDVLAGFVGGLLAQSAPPFEAAAAAVWHHAEAARRFGPGLIAEDLSETLPAVLRERWAAYQAETSNQVRKPPTT